MGYCSAISMVFQMQSHFQNLGINSIQNSPASWVYKAALQFSQENTWLEIERPAV